MTDEELIEEIEKNREKNLINLMNDASARGNTQLAEKIKKIILTLKNKK